METAELIDYAHPMMMAENRLKAAHNELLHGDMEKGLGELTQAVVETRLAAAAVRHMMEKRR